MEEALRVEHYEHSTQTTQTARPVVTVRERRPVSGGAIGFGVILVLIGLGLLISRVAGVSPYLQRYFGGISLWSMWPLVIVLTGIVTVFTPDHKEGRWTIARLADGVAGIVLGLVLLTNSVGWVPWSMWRSVWSLWPILLVICGIACVEAATKLKWLRIVTAVIFCATLILCALAWWQGPGLLPALWIPGQ
ncbi:MAG: DUF5668 domain-containing protein [Actinomycetes bacterium]|jgi:hypothetical protein|nr:DUF5668 domain-containing protein [Actinomycetes bacterium]